MATQPEQLAQEFQRQFKLKYGRYPYALANVKNGKWWKHFENFSENAKLTDGYITLFVKRLFDEWREANMLYPYVLSQKPAHALADGIMASLDKHESKLSEKDYIKMTLEKCNKWCLQNGIEEDKLRSFILNKTNQMLADRGNYYKPLFQFSSKYIEEYGITEEEKLKKKAVRAFFPKVYETLQQSLQDDFID